LKIKILHIIKSLGRGGAEMLLPETLKSHNKEQFEFHYLYFLPWKNQLVEAIEKAGGKVTCLTANNNIQLLLQYPKIVRYCKEHQIQLIHAHLPWAGFVSRLVHLITRTPLFYTEHNLQERYHFITKLLNKLSFNWQTLGIGVSEDVTQSIQKNISPSIPVKTILNGVNTTTFQRKNSQVRAEIREEFGIPNDAVLVGTVAVFRFQKRLDLWLEIMAEANKQNPIIYGIIVGAGPLEPILKEKHAALGLEGKVFFAGLQTNVKPYYEAMDIFMMCSSFEGLPIALLEAMSMGCAIVSTDAGGIKEVLRPDQDGFVVSVDNWSSLSKSIVALAEDDQKLKDYQSLARQRVVESFSIEVMVHSLEKLYLEQTL
jgi:glycosyltransferase involved in cell wall biosynthesis